MARLIQVGFGAAGTEIVRQHLGKRGDLDLLAHGRKVEAIFGFCDIRRFTDATEVLQERVMQFVNVVAHIVHSKVRRYHGNPNKNIGDAFLLVWKATPTSSMAAAEGGALSAREDAEGPHKATRRRTGMVVSRQSLVPGTNEMVAAAVAAAANSKPGSALPPPPPPPLGDLTPIRLKRLTTDAGHGPADGYGLGENGVGRWSRADLTHGVSPASTSSHQQCRMSTDYSTKSTTAGGEAITSQTDQWGCTRVWEDGIPLTDHKLSRVLGQSASLPPRHRADEALKAMVQVWSPPRGCGTPLSVTPPPTYFDSPRSRASARPSATRIHCLRRSCTICSG
jgi:hypothetical protein